MKNPPFAVIGFITVLDGDFIDEPTIINITNSHAYIDDDPNWSPDGQKIVFTRHGVNDNHMNSITAEICVLNLGTGDVECHLGDNGEEERAPVWSRTVRASRTCAEAAFKSVRFPVPPSRSA